MGSKARTAHDVITPAVQGDMDRVRAAVARVMTDRQDPEAIHDFRVGLRRLRTVLRACRDIYGKKRMKRLEKAFKGFGDATNALRDAEVLEETIEAAKVDESHAEAVAAWLVERRRHQEALRDDAMAVIERNDLEEAFAALLDRIAKRPKKDMSMKRFAKTRLADVQAGVAELLPVSRDDVAGLHRLRIRFKRLRYTCEMLDRFVGVAEAGGTREKTTAAFGKIAKQAKEMQKVLGLLHDADVAIETVASSDTLAADDRDAVTRGLLELRSRLVDESVDRLEALPSWVLGDQD